MEEEETEPLLFNIEVIIRNAPDTGLLPLLLESSSLTGETGGTESVPLNLWPKREERLRWCGRTGLSIRATPEVEYGRGRSLAINDGRVMTDRACEPLDLVVFKLIVLKFEGRWLSPSGQHSRVPASDLAASSSTVDTTVDEVAVAVGSVRGLVINVTSDTVE